MKRDRLWWRLLSADERRELFAMEHSPRYGGYGAGGYLPDDCSECGHCGQPMLGSGWCSACWNRWEQLTSYATKMKGRVLRKLTEQRQNIDVQMAGRVVKEYNSPGDRQRFGE